MDILTQSFYQLVKEDILLQIFFVICVLKCILSIKILLIVLLIIFVLYKQISYKMMWIVFTGVKLLTVVEYYKIWTKLIVAEYIVELLIYSAILLRIGKRFNCNKLDVIIITLGFIELLTATNKLLIFEIIISRLFTILLVIIKEIDYKQKFFNKVHVQLVANIYLKTPELLSGALNGLITGTLYRDIYNYISTQSDIFQYSDELDKIKNILKYIQDVYTSLIPPLLIQYILAFITQLPITCLYLLTNNISNIVVLCIIEIILTILTTEPNIEKILFGQYFTEQRELFENGLRYSIDSISMAQNGLHVIIIARNSKNILVETTVKVTNKVVDSIKYGSSVIKNKTVNFVQNHPYIALASTIGITSGVTGLFLWKKRR